MSDNVFSGKIVFQGVEYDIEGTALPTGEPPVLPPPIEPPADLNFDLSLGLPVGVSVSSAGGGLFRAQDTIVYLQNKDMPRLDHDAEGAFTGLLLEPSLSNLAKGDNMRPSATDWEIGAQGAEDINDAEAVARSGLGLVAANTVLRVRGESGSANNDGTALQPGLLSGCVLARNADHTTTDAEGRFSLWNGDGATFFTSRDFEPVIFEGVPGDSESRLRLRPWAGDIRGVRWLGATMVRGSYAPRYPIPGNYGSLPGEALTFANGVIPAGEYNVVVTFDSVEATLHRETVSGAYSVPAERLVGLEGYAGRVKRVRFEDPTDAPVDPPPVEDPVYNRPFGVWARFPQDERTGIYPQSRWDKLNHPRVAGAIPIIPALVINPSLGVWNFAEINIAIQEAKTRGKKVGIYMRDFVFSGPGSDPANSHPPHILNNHEIYGGLPGQGGLFLHSNKDFNNGEHTRGSNRYRTAYWVAAVTDWRLELMGELFAWLNSHADKDVVSFVVNSASTSGGQHVLSEWNDTGAFKYSPEALRDELERYIRAIAAMRQDGGPDFCFDGEFIPWEPEGADGRGLYLRHLYEVCAELQVGWCQPDPKKNKATFDGRSYPMDTLAYAALNKTWAYNHGEFAAAGWDRDSYYGGGNSYEDQMRMYIAPSTAGGLKLSAMACMLGASESNPQFDFDRFVSFFDDDRFDPSLLAELQAFAEKGTS